MLLDLPLLSFLLLTVTCCWAHTERLAPLFPCEWWAGFRQTKWNLNGNRINHTASGAWYSSCSQGKMMITAGTYGTQNASAPDPYDYPTAATEMSLLDFVGNVTVQSWQHHPTDPSTCIWYPGTGGYFRPPPPDFLRVVHAVYAGPAYHPELGKLDQWTTFLGVGTVINFFFDSSETLRRWTLQGQDLETGVDTIYDQFHVVKHLGTELFAANTSRCKKGV